MRRYELHINGKDFSISVHTFSSKRADLEIAGVRYTVDVRDIITEGESAPVSLIGETARTASAAGVANAAPSASRPTPAGGAGSVTAPIPGQMLAVLVKEGDLVEAGHPLLKIEAMKMENTIIAPIAGTVRAVFVNAGDAVMQGQELLVIG
jgi:glutaconyl-CoA/methylmalonyl-CoA decarboxylase subunit gamma